MRLVFLFFLHWTIVLIAMSYVFVRKNATYDFLYINILAIIFVGWLINKNECIISYWEKEIMDPTYTLGDDPTWNPSLSFYSRNPSIQWISVLVIVGFIMYNLITLARIHKVDPYVVGTLIVVGTIMFLGYRWQIT